ncbi:MAG: hypothetical protein R3E55_07970 [Burkholderiaceae bacterium]
MRRSEVTRITERGHIDLQETLCDAVLDALLAHPQVVACVSTRKPDVYDDCDAVARPTRAKPSLLLTPPGTMTLRHRGPGHR